MKNLFPWYDAHWLSAYVRAKRLLQSDYPHKYSEFIAALEPLRTRLDFQPIQIGNFFDAKTLAEIKDLIIKLKQEEFEKHEFFNFGRLVVHDHPYFNQLQTMLTPLVSEKVGELVEPGYNFLSLYNNLGICGVHMDAPYAKYTLDVCIEQSHPWPIHFSQVQPWPEEFHDHPDWEQTVKSDPDNIFTPYALKAGEAVIFSGSSQWHYRERIPRNKTEKLENNFCHLIFFHFIPQGMAHIMKPKNWPALFDLPALDRVIAQKV
jgi:hypothetical protein